MKNSSTVFFVSMILLLQLSSCNNSDHGTAVTEQKAVETPKAVDTSNTNWHTGKGKKVKFRYPGNWVMKTRDGAQGTQTFGLIEKTEKDFGNFFVFEIHEMETRGFPFKDFKFGSIDWLSQRFQGKTTVRNTEDITFNGAEARKYEVELNDSKEPTPVELYAVNGVSRYYLLLYFKNATDGPVVKRIMDSIVFDK